MQTFRYRTTGQLTGTIDREDVGLAQAYLAQDDMTQYVYPAELAAVVAHVEWHLDANGHDYRVDVKTTEKLGEAGLKDLASWISGQNSDGLGESFEQQAFAEREGEDEDDWEMVSFDWKTNDSALTLLD
jgi:hypothetical protein